MTSIFFLVETIQSKQFRCIYLKNKKPFLYLCVHFSNLRQILNIFQKKMTLTAYEFLKLQTPKHVLREISENSPFRWPLDTQHGKREEKLLHSQWQHLSHIHWSLWKKLSLKKTPLVSWKILKLFVNSLTTDDKYSLLKRNDWIETIQMYLYEKPQTFSIFLCDFSNLHQILNICQKGWISEITDPEKRG